MASRGLNVFVNIGATVASSVGASASAVQKRIGSLGKALKVQAAESKIYAREMNASYANMAGLFIGGGAFAGLHKMVTASSEYAHELSNLRNAGRTTSEIAQAIAHANETMKALPTATLTDNLKVLNETTLAYGNFQHALDNLTFNQKMGGMLQNMLGSKAGDPGDMFNSLIRVMEMRMGADAGSPRARGELSKLYQAMIESNGKVNPAEILGFAQTANPAMRGYSERFFTRIVPSLIQEFGGERAGTGLTAFNNQILGRVGVGGKKITEEWIRLGLVPRLGSGGNLSKSGWTPGSMKGTSLAMSDPLAFAEQFLLPAMAKHGVNINDEKSVMLESKKLFGRETGARLGGTLLSPQQRSRLHKDEGMYAKALGPDAAYTQALANDPTLAMASAAASIKNLEITIGKAITPEVILGLTNFARGVNYLAAVIDKHPTVGKAIGGLLAGIVGITGFKLAKSAFGFLGFAKMFSGGFKMLFGSVSKAGPMIPLINRIGSALRILFVEGLGGLAVGIGEALMGAVTAGLAILASPLVLAALAVAAIALAWAFRKQIAQAWHVVAEWFGTAFEFIKGKVLAMDWASIGWAIADGMTFGLASRLPAAAGAIKNALTPHTTATWHPGMNYHGNNAPHRAMGGSVSAGSAYDINERGGEMFVPGRSGTMIPAGATAALIAALSGGFTTPAAASPAPVTFGDIHVYEAHDAQATARAVRAELHRMASSQSALLSD